jgi:hypothetical protein
MLAIVSLQKEKASSGEIKAWHNLSINEPSDRNGQ